MIIPASMPRLTANIPWADVETDKLGQRHRDMRDTMRVHRDLFNHRVLGAQCALDGNASLTLVQNDRLVDIGNLAPELEDYVDRVRAVTPKPLA